LKYKFGEICLLINSNNEIKNFLKEINDPQSPYDQEILEKIISKLNQGELKKIDEEIQSVNFSNINLEAKADKIILENGTNILVYKEFIFIREKIFNVIKSKLTLYSNIKSFYYTYKDGDILATTEKFNSCIFFGNYNKESHLFNLRYILKFYNEESINKELKFILNNGIERYKEEKTIFNEENNKDLISAIYDGNNEIGNFYKYRPGINYQNITLGYNTNDINNNKLDLVLKLYNYYEDFKQKMNKSYEHDEKYFLIKKEIMDDVKKDINYNFIVQILNKANINKIIYNNNKRQKLFILKNFPEESYDDFFKSQPFEKRLKDYISPNEISITIPNGKNESVHIYDNFEIIEHSIANEFINEVYEKTYHHNYYGCVYLSSSTSITVKGENYINCTLKDGKVIINYPKEKFKNNKYVYALGFLDNENTFKAEYLLIYKKDHGYFNNIKNNLNNYLQSIEQNLMFGPSPLTGYKCEEIGMAIGLNQINKNNIQNIDNNSNQPMDIEKNNIYQDQNKYKKDYEITSPQKDSNIYPNSLIKIDIKEYNLDSQQPFSKITDCFNIPPLIGLDNIGATCYMNATLQCLCNIQKFVNYFKYNKTIIPAIRSDVTYGNNLLSSSFKLLIEKLWPDRLMAIYNSNPNYPYGNYGSNNLLVNKKNESYAPQDFKAKISKMNPLFKGVAANDAKDLVNFLIMTLHEELNRAPKKDMTNSAINQDQSNQQLMFNLFTQDFVNNNKSIISDLFYGVNYNIVQCQNCFHKSYNYQTYFFFVFPLEEVRIFKSQNNFNNNFNYNMNFNNNEVNIYDCFLYDQKINYMMGENAMYCNYCKRTTNTQMCTVLTFGPEIIIIILNRGKGIQYKVKINFVEQLNLYNFIEHKETGYNYQLIGVITHLGGDGMDGHFIAYCKNPINNLWYQFNDSIVKEVNYANFKTEVIDYAMPYLLFYQKVGV
jgi:ubiquitin C-terminal hydrolase